MGWLFKTHLGGHDDPRAYLDAQFAHADSQSKTSVLRSSLTDRRVYYAAIERIQFEDNTRIVFAVICLVKYSPRAKDGYIFGYKDMDETVGPHECDCPAAILDLLTETHYPYALEWRATCRSRIELRRSNRAKPKPKIGDTVVLSQPMRFTDGSDHARFKVVSMPRNRGPIYQSLENYGHYRIPKLSTLDYHLEPSG